MYSNTKRRLLLTVRLQLGHVVIGFAKVVVVLLTIGFLVQFLFKDRLIDVVFFIAGALAVFAIAVFLSEFINSVFGEYTVRIKSSMISNTETDEMKQLFERIKSGAQLTQDDNDKLITVFKKIETANNSIQEHRS